MHIRHIFAGAITTLLLIIALFIYVPFFAIKPVHAVTIFESDFEGADTEWTGTVTSGSGSLSLNSTNTPYAGSECGEFNMTYGGTVEAYAYKTLAAAYDNMTFSAWYRWNTTAEWRKFLRLSDSSGNGIVTFMMGQNDWKMFYWNGYATMNSTTVGHTISANRYQNITVVSWINAANGYHKMYINSTLVINIVGINNTRYGNIQRINVGYLYDSAYEYLSCRVDNVKATAGEAEDYPPFYTTSNSNSTLAGNGTQIRTYWNDAYGLSHYYFEHNNTGAYVNQTVVAFSTYPQWATCNFTLNSTVGAYVKWRSFANDTIDQSNYTAWQTITVTSDQYPQYGAISYNTTETSMPCNFTCAWTDDFGLSGFIFGTNNTGAWTNETWTSLTGTSDLASKVKTLNSTGAMRVGFRFWANDTGNKWNNTGIQYLITGGDQDFYAATGSSTNIQTAIDTCEAAGGGTVHIPSGNYDFSPSPTWTTVTIDLTALSYNMTITGATTSKDGDNQVITWLTVLNMSWEATDSEEFFEVTGNASATITIRFTDIKLVGWRFYNTSSVTIYTGIYFDEVQNWRVDHCCFQDMCGSGIYSSPEMDYHVSTPNCGLADHNVLNNTIGNPGFMDYDRAPPYGSGSRTLGYGIGMRRWACDVWDSTLTNVVGHYNNYSLYIENNRFSRWRHCAMINDGLHMVFRYNIVEYDYCCGSVDAHGSYADDGAPYAKGSRCLEVYNNTFREPDQTTGTGYTSRKWAINLRGGSGFITNNTLEDGTYDYDDLVDLNNDWGNYVPYCPECRINKTFIWSNTLNGADVIGYNSDSTENVNYYLRAPTVGDDGFTYTPYTYPHTLISGSPNLSPSFSSIGSVNTVAGQDVKLYGYWNDDSGLATFWIQHNSTGVLANTTATSFSGTPAWSNTSITLNYTIGVVVMWRVWANDTSGAEASCSYQYITVTAYASTTWRSWWGNWW